MVCHLSQRALIRLSGADVRPFLQGQLTQDVALLAPDRPLYAGLLTPQGKALAELFLFADGADVLLDVGAERLEPVAKRLAMMRLRAKVNIAPEPALRLFAAWGAGADGPADPRLAAAGTRFLAPPDHPATATLADWHAHRLPLGLPEADEIGSDQLLWLETNARELNGVSFTKGCYTGQENTARMHHRDRLRKRLLPLALPANADGPGIGSPVMAGDREAGHLAGAAHGNLRMALIRMDHADAPLRIGGEPARLVPPPWLPAEG